MGHKRSVSWQSVDKDARFCENPLVSALPWQLCVIWQRVYKGSNFCILEHSQTNRGHTHSVLIVLLTPYTHTSTKQLDFHLATWFWPCFLFFLHTHRCVYTSADTTQYHHPSRAGIENVNHCHKHTCVHTAVYQGKGSERTSNGFSLWIIQRWLMITTVRLNQKYEIKIRFSFPKISAPPTGPTSTTRCTTARSSFSRFLSSSPPTSGYTHSSTGGNTYLLLKYFPEIEWEFRILKTLIIL